MSAFITFEGPDGVGKSTQFLLLAETLEGMGYAVTRTREPGGCPLGERIRPLLLDGGEVDPHAEALLFAAARAQHAKELILPRLLEGGVVLCDRYVDSSIAYQGFGRGLGSEWIEQINRVALREAMPGRTYLLMMDAEAAMRRHALRAPDRMERESPDFRKRVAEGFAYAARAFPQRVRVLDASREPDEIAREIDADCVAFLSRQHNIGV